MRLIAFKGFTKDLTARLGRGNYKFHPGETVYEESSKTVRNGFHCCENPFECLAYYPLGRDNRYFKVEAAGSIDEDNDHRIACTEMTLLKELTIKELAGYGMLYMAQHPLRDGWEQSGENLRVRKDSAEALAKGHIAIARGQDPLVKGVEGAILGLILEPSIGEVCSARIFEVTKEQAGKWFTLDRDRNLREVVI